MTIPPVILNPEADGLVVVLVDRGIAGYAIEIGKPERFNGDHEYGFESRLTTNGNEYAGRLVTFTERE